MRELADYSLMILLGVLPSIIWLFYYLRKDCHPEPKYLLTETFLMGIILSPLAIIAQLLFVKTIEEFFPGIPTRGTAFFAWAALIEELVKFYAVMFIALYSADFDEPVDAMIYMIVAGLGFAAMENILVMFNVMPNSTDIERNYQQVFGVWGLRFAGATLLHALSCAITGYFIGLAWFFEHHAKKLIAVGLILATFFHLGFNLLLSSSGEEHISLLYTMSLLIVMAFLVSVLFDRIKRQHNENVSIPVQV